MGDYFESLLQTATIPTSSSMLLSPYMSLSDTFSEEGGCSSIPTLQPPTNGDSTETMNVDAEFSPSSLFHIDSTVALHDDTWNATHPPSVSVAETAAEGIATPVAMDMHSTFVLPIMDQLKANMSFILQFCHSAADLPLAWKDPHHSDYAWVSPILSTFFGEHLHSIMHHHGTSSCALNASTTTIIAPTTATTTNDEYNNELRLPPASFPTRKPCTKLDSKKKCVRTDTTTDITQEIDTVNTTEKDNTSVLFTTKRRGRKANGQAALSEKVNALQRIPWLLAQQTASNGNIPFDPSVVPDLSVVLSTFSTHPPLVQVDPTQCAVNDEESEETIILVYDPETYLHMVDHLPPSMNLLATYSSSSSANVENGVRVVHAKQHRPMYDRVLATMTPTPLHESSSPSSDMHDTSIIFPTIAPAVATLSMAKMWFDQVIPDVKRHRASHVLVNNGQLICPVLVHFAKDPRKTPRSNNVEITSQRPSTHSLKCSGTSVSSTEMTDMLPPGLVDNGVLIVANLIHNKRLPEHLLRYMTLTRGDGGGSRKKRKSIYASSNVIEPGGVIVMSPLPLGPKDNLYPNNDAISIPPSLRIHSQQAIDTVVDGKTEGFSIRSAYPVGSKQEVHDVAADRIVARFVPRLSTLLTLDRRALYSRDELIKLDDAIERSSIDDDYNFVLPTPAKFYRAINNNALSSAVNVRLHDLRTVYPINSTSVSVSISSFARAPVPETSSTSSTLDPQRWFIPPYPQHLFEEGMMNPSTTSITTTSAFSSQANVDLIQGAVTAHDRRQQENKGALVESSIYRGEDLSCGNTAVTSLLSPLGNTIGGISNNTNSSHPGQPKKKLGATTPVATPVSPRQFQAIIQLRRGQSQRVYIGQRTSVAQDGRLAIDLLEHNEKVGMTVFSILSDQAFCEIINDTPIFANLLAYYFQDYTAMRGSMLEPITEGLWLPTDAETPTIQHVRDTILANYKFNQNVNQTSSVTMTVPARWILPIHMAFEDLDFYVENELFVPRKWQLRTFDHNELLEIAKVELERLYDENMKVCKQASVISTYHKKLAGEFPHPLATFIRIVLNRLYDSPMYTTQWFQKNSPHLFTRCGAITRAQQEQIADAYFWCYLAPHAQRIPEYKTTILDIYSFQGVHSTLVFPHHATGQHRGRSSASGLLRPSKKLPQLPSKHVAATPQGETAISRHTRQASRRKNKAAVNIIIPALETTPALEITQVETSPISLSLPPQSLLDVTDDDENSVRGALPFDDNLPQPSEQEELLMAETLSMPVNTSQESEPSVMSFSSSKRRKIR